MRFLRTPALAAVLAVACSSPPPPLVRDYTAYAGTLSPASGGSERTMRVTLKDGGAAAVQVSSPGPSGDFFADGSWQLVDGRIVIELPSTPAARLVFRRSGELMLGREWDRALWGEKEPVLYRVR